MPKVNPFSFFLVVIKTLSFSCSPIHRRRLEFIPKLDNDFINQSRKYSLNEKESDKTKSNEIKISHAKFEKELKNIGSNDDFSYLLWALMHPIETMNLIKKYHMVGNAFIAMFLIHILLVTHLTIKSIIYAFFANSNQVLHKYLTDIYYPHTAGVFREPKLFNNLILILCLLTMCVRLCSAYNLIKNSIINCGETYKEVRMSQVNFSNLSIYELTLFDWIEFLIYSRQHDKEVECDPIVARAHFKFEKLNKIKLDFLNQKESLYYYNLFDFEECYSDFIMFDPNKRNDKYSDWHCPIPGPRVSVGQLRSMIFVIMLIELTTFLTLACSLLGCVYLELRSILPLDNEIDQTTTLLFTSKEHLFELKHLIRMFELFTFILLQLPLHYDSGLIYLDATILLSRLSKLSKIFQYDLIYDTEEREVFMETLEKSSNLNSRVSYVHLNDIFLEDLNYPPTVKENNDANKDDNNREENDDTFEDLNTKVQHNVKLTKLLYLEFVDLKRVHTTYLNLLIIVNGLTVSYIISIIFKINNTAELIILGAIIFSCLAPTLNTLFVCAMIERKVSYNFSIMILIFS